MAKGLGQMMYDPDNYDKEKARKAAEVEKRFAKKTQQTLLLSNYMDLADAFKQTTGIDLEIDGDDDNV